MQSSGDARTPRARRVHPHVRSVRAPLGALLLDGGGRRFPCLDGGLREFELYYKPHTAPGEGGGGRRHPPPMLALRRFSHTLRVLTICSASASGSSYSDNPYRLAFPAATDAAVYGALQFPTLVRLTLKHVSVSDAALHAVLSRFPALQSLVLHKNEGYGYGRRLVIRSPTLRSLGVSDDAAEVVVDDAPMLERLIPRDLAKAVRIQVVHAPRLKTFGYLSDKISEFEVMGTTVLKGMVPAADASSTIRTVKILALHSPRDFDAVVDLLKCFPCGEKLYMELNHYGDSINNVKSKLKRSARHKFNNVPLECLDTHLKVLELRNYRGTKSEMSLVRFFISKARVLESAKFLVAPYKYGKGRKWIVSQRKKLLLNIRASRGARFHFEIGGWLSSCVPIEHIHNLAIDDPFGRSSCSCPYDDFK